jgi:hypothetical protein
MWNVPSWVDLGQDPRDQVKMKKWMSIESDK